MGVIICPLIEIGLADLPKYGPRHPPAPTGLRSRLQPSSPEWVEALCEKALLSQIISSISILLVASISYIEIYHGESSLSTLKNLTKI